MEWQLALAEHSHGQGTLEFWLENDNTKYSKTHKKNV